jgi:SAM-dependent methyltransferase
MTSRKSWDEFWGTLLLLRCHQDNPARWTKRQERAAGIFETLALRSGCRILDLGCGDGVLDICLARLGARITAVDRISTVLDAARQEPDAGLVEFVLGDLRDLDFPPASYDVVLMLELVGLMSTKDDGRLISNAGRWLVDGGFLIVDCPLSPEKREGQSRQELSGGILEYRWTYDPSSRLQHIEPRFETVGEEVIVLHDPYDSSKPDHMGVLRYLYPKAKLRGILEGQGFRVRELDSLTRKGFYTFLGECVGSSGEGA